MFDDQVPLEENTTIATSLPEGAPYEIVDRQVSLGALGITDSIQLRVAADGQLKEVENYMTEFYPFPESPELSVIENRRRLYSPFVASIVHDMVSGDFDDIEGMRVTYPAVRERLVDYEPLLRFDPVFEVKCDRTYIDIQPTPWDVQFNLTVKQLEFLRAAIATYLNGEIDIRNYLLTAG
jgi:hypothetical protein